MKNLILLFLLAPISVFAQNADHSLKIDPEMDKDSVYIMLSEADPIKYRQGKGEWVNYEGFKEDLGLIFGRNWFSANLTSNGNHTHNAGNDIYTVNNIGRWLLTAGSTGQSVYAMDSTAVAIHAPDITLTKGIGLSPRLWIDSANDRILITTLSGNYSIENLPTFADDTAAGVGGLLAGRLYKTSAGVVMVKL